MLRELTITPVLNGWIVKVGCQTVVFESLPGLLGALDDYYHDPNGVQTRYLESAINAKIMFPPRDLANAPDIGSMASMPNEGMETTGRG